MCQLGAVRPMASVPVLPVQAVPPRASGLPVRAAPPENRTMASGAPEAERPTGSVPVRAAVVPPGPKQPMASLPVPVRAVPPPQAMEPEPEPGGDDPAPAEPADDPDEPAAVTATVTERRPKWILPRRELPGPYRVLVRYWSTEPEQLGSRYSTYLAAADDHDNEEDKRELG